MAASGEVQPLDSPSIPANSGAQGPNPAMMRRPRHLGGSARRGQCAEGDESRAAQPRVSIKTNRGEQRGAGGGGRAAEGGCRSPARRAVGRRGSARVVGGRRGAREEKPPSREPLRHSQEKGVEGGIWVPP
jgi:hypothetical protein